MSSIVSLRITLVNARHRREPPADPSRKAGARPPASARRCRRSARPLPGRPPAAPTPPWCRQPCPRAWRRSWLRWRQRCRCGGTWRRACPLPASLTAAARRPCAVHAPPGPRLLSPLPPGAPRDRRLAFECCPAPSSLLCSALLPLSPGAHGRCRGGRRGCPGGAAGRGGPHRLPLRPAPTHRHWLPRSALPSYPPTIPPPNTHSHLPSHSHLPPCR